MNEPKTQLLAAVDAHKEDMIAFLKELVRQPSTLGNERAAQEIVYRKLKSLGLDANLWEPSLDQLAGHPAFAPVEWDYKGRPNVTGTYRAQCDGGRSVILNGHIDVVSPEPLHQWDYDPYGARITGSRMYGRGAGDMKGGIAMMVLALEAVIAAGVRLNGDVFVETVIEEECGGNGTLACRLNGYSRGASAAVVPEPFALHYNLADMGIMWFRVRVRSGSAHVAEAHKHGNIIESCFGLMRALRELEAQMNAEVDHPLYIDHEHPINLNVGIIQGGHWPSSVPSECTFECRLSYLPGVANADVRARVEACILAAAQQDPLLRDMPPQIEYYGLQSDGCVIDTESLFIKTLGHAHKEATGRELNGFADTGTTDVRYFTLYEDEIPATCYGPLAGSIHAANEYVDLDSIITGAKTLALFLLDWCGYEA